MILKDLDENEEAVDSDGGSPSPARIRSRSNYSTVNDRMIDIDSNGEEVEVQRRPGKASKPVNYERRNPPIFDPLTSLENYNYNGFNLRPGKTVELKMVTSYAFHT
jgi:hypothetical protein